MQDVRKIKQLQSQLSALKADYESAKIAVATKQKECSDIKNRMMFIQDNIDKASVKTTDLKVSEHAILRYFERVTEINIEDIQKQILSDEIIGYATTLGGSGKYPNKKGFTVVMKDNTVTTITKP